MGSHAGGRRGASLIRTGHFFIHKTQVCVRQVLRVLQALNTEIIKFQPKHIIRFVNINLITQCLLFLLCGPTRDLWS